MVKIRFDITEDECNKLLKLFDPKADIGTGHSEKKISVMCNHIIKDYLFENKTLFPREIQ